MDKNSFRNIVKYRKNMTDELILNEDKKNSEIIVRKYLESEYFKKADIILAYSSMKNEIPTDRIISLALKKNKKVGLPKVITGVKDGSLMEFLRVNKDTTYKKGVYGIMEPQGDEHLNLSELNIEILIPGLCFDLSKNRLGYGGGYYDRYLERINNIKVHLTALAYEYQIFEEIPTERYDRPVNLIITENRCII